MKGLAVGIALLAAFVAVVLFAWPKKTAGPEPLNFGRDSCAQCRMLISRPGYGGELRDPEGDLTKFDDLGCLLIAMFNAHREFPEAWVEDHPSGKLIALVGATLVRDSRVQTPMGYNLLAFQQAADAEAFAHNEGGEVVALEAVLKDSERFRQKGKRL